MVDVEEKRCRAPGASVIQTLAIHPKRSSMPPDSIQTAPPHLSSYAPETATSWKAWSLSLLSSCVSSLPSQCHETLLSSGHHPSPPLSLPNPCSLPSAPCPSAIAKVTHYLPQPSHECFLFIFWAHHADTQLLIPLLLLKYFHPIYPVFLSMCCLHASS